MSLKTSPEQKWSDETEGKDAQKDEHPNPHLFLIFLIPHVAIHAGLIRTNPWFAREFDWAKADPAMLVGLDFSRSSSGDPVGHSLKVFFDFLCIYHRSSPRVQSMFHRRVGRPGPFPAN